MIYYIYLIIIFYVILLGTMTSLVLYNQSIMEKTNYLKNKQVYLNYSNEKI